MVMLTPAQEVEVAQRVVATFDRYEWGQNAYARGGDGALLRFTGAPDAVMADASCLCLLGAIRVAVATVTRCRLPVDNADIEAVARLYVEAADIEPVSRSSGMVLADWNDDPARTRDEVQEVASRVLDMVQMNAMNRLREH
ncbi:MAG: hypothetical protein OXE50_06730 [Chloroflexi bacterium]|nr:hypothetical protein [Chloroflexota bacterium]